MENDKKSGLLKICEFIVDKRGLFFLAAVILSLFSAVSAGWVRVENELSAYLPDTTETRQGLDLMEEEFTTYGSCSVMVANVSYEQALLIRDQLLGAQDVFRVEFDDTSVHYAHGSALYNVTFAYDQSDDRCLEALEGVEQLLEGKDYYLDTDLGDIQSELLDEEMRTISVLVVIIVITVLLLTSSAYAEIPVLLLTFGFSALIQMGTNFLLGKISFVSDSVTIVLQLALSVDYAVILLNRYKEELEQMAPREAAITALSKAIPEIAGSSLTTIGGLFAMMFMQFGIGRDLGVVLIKAIILSLLSVFTLMPGLILLFSKAMKLTRHRKFIPEIPFVGRFAYKTRYIMAPAFFLVIIAAAVISAKCPYVYGKSLITPPIINRVQETERMQREYFDTKNMLALVVPAGDYVSEAAILRELEACDEVYDTMGLANTEAIGGYYLADALTPRQFSELIGIDYSTAELVYAAYAVDDQNYAKVVNGLAEYGVPLIDMFGFVYREVQDGYVTLDDELMRTLEEANRMMTFARNQLQGEHYARMILYLNLPEESDETLAFMERIHRIAEEYYDADQVLLVGESVSDKDLAECFARDNKIVSMVSILTVLVVLLFTFKSVGMPLLLILVIQGSIWINFSVPALQHDYLFFLGYLIVSSIQMGANIDYAIVIASRYMELRKSMLRKATVIKTMNQSFPTIITSGTMLAVAGILIGRLTSDCAIYGIGKCLGRGTIISILITMFVLPQILLVGDRIIEKTYFTMGTPGARKETGTMRLDGRVKGYISGAVDGVVHAVVKGVVNAHVESAELLGDGEAENGQTGRDEK
ncbi:MAG: MMPL family transporter [Lachnospiraceae bacterium]|nr:MMPL family transporter [Lachnospiraceae bacterium]